MRRASGVDVYGETRIFADQGAGDAGVIQVDVGKEDGVEVGDGQALVLQGLAQSVQCGRWAGVDKGAVAGGLEQSGGYGAEVAAPVAQHILADYFGKKVPPL